LNYLGMQVEIIEIFAEAALLGPKRPESYSIRGHHPKPRVKKPRKPRPLRRVGRDVMAHFGKRCVSCGADSPTHRCPVPMAAE